MHYDESVIDNVTSPTEENDFGLTRIAEHLGKTEALLYYREGAAKEADGDINGAIVLYKRAYRIWPAMDSITEGGIPKCVREEAAAVGFHCEGLLDRIDVAHARNSHVMRSSALFTAFDLEEIECVLKGIMANGSALVNNPQNATHQHKFCTFLNNPPTHAFQQQAPRVLTKMLDFITQAWNEANWSGSAGPLHAIVGGPESLSIRLVEHWEYEVGGGLIDPFHYDNDSVVTIVALLSSEDEFEGGVFRTHEADGLQLEHPMKMGDAICFVSHKYHNIAKVTRGRRRSIVMELWQGGQRHMGRGD